MSADSQMQEERQREIEKLQRQQLEHMRSFGSPDGGNMYGGGQQYSPYGMNMGMMGLPMGYNVSFTLSTKQGVLQLTLVPF